MVQTQEEGFFCVKNSEDKGTRDSISEALEIFTSLKMMPPSHAFLKSHRRVVP